MKLLPLREGTFKLYAICNEREDCAVLDFLDSVGSTLEPQADQIRDLWTRMKKDGKRYLPYSVCHQIDKPHELWELVTKKLRVVFFLDGDDSFIFTDGFFKKKQEIKREDKFTSIEKRKQYFREKATRTFEYLEPLEE